MAIENSSGGGSQSGSGNSSDSQQGGGQGSGAGSSASNPNNPNLGGSGGNSVIELSEDSMVRLPGAKDPVRYGDHNRGFQSEFTKKAQAAAQAQRQIQQLKAKLTEHERRQRQGQQAQRPDPKAQTRELAESIKSLSYLSGQDAAKVVEHLTERFNSQETALQQRDIALGLMYKQLKQVSQLVSGLQGRHSATEFEGKIDRFVTSGGLPKEATEFAKELYLAYEGDDLDQEFPAILKRRWEQLSGIYKASEKARVDQARRQPFVPGKGGNGTPSKPLNQNFAKASAKEIAEAFWPGMVDGEVET